MTLPQKTPASHTVAHSERGRRGRERKSDRGTAERDKSGGFLANSLSFQLHSECDLPKVCLKVSATGVRLPCGRGGHLAVSRVCHCSCCLTAVLVPQSGSPVCPPHLPPSLPHPVPLLRGPKSHLVKGDQIWLPPVRFGSKQPVIHHC